MRGIDVSHWQKPNLVNYSELAKDHRFVIARATYGVSKDKTFLDHIARAKAVGLAVGAYAFYRPTQDVGDQLEAFGEIVEVAGIGTGWIPPALDIEDNEANGDGALSRDRYDDACHTILESWEAKWGTPLVYTNPSSWFGIGSPRWLGDYLVWISHFGVKEPRVPFKLPWHIWQFTGSGYMEKVFKGGALDINTCEKLPLLGKVTPLGTEKPIV